MKTLKKALCLVLALVMVVGTMAISAAAFEDDDKINDDYAEAVAVLSAIKVIDGYDNGNFGAEDDVTRAQALAFVVRAMLTRATTNKLPAAATEFADVAQDWQKGVVAYAVAEGMANGWNGNFAPNDKVTGYAFLKFVLTALGIEGEYTGNNWELNVLLAANDAGLLDGMEEGFDLADTVNRQQAAQLAYNMINYAPDGATNGYVVKDANGDTVYDGTDPVTALLMKQSDGTYTLTVKTVNTGSMSNKLYGLSREETTDNYGRAIVKVTGKDKVNVVLTNDSAFSGKGAVKYADIAKALGATGGKTVTLKIFEDGVEGETKADVNAGTEGTVGALGSTVEVYKDGNVYNVVVTNIYADVVGTVNKAVAATATAAATKRSIELKESKLVKETESFAKDDVVLYTKLNGAIDTIALADVVMGKITAKGTDYIRVDGEKYNYHAAIADKLVLGETKAFYLDGQKNIILVADVAENTATVTYDKVYVLGFSSAVKTNTTGNNLFDTASSEEWTVQAKIVDLKTGEIKVVNVATATGTDKKVYLATPAGAASDKLLTGAKATDVNAYVAAGFHDYAVVDGKYAIAAAELATTDVTLNKSNALMATDIYANNKTVVYVLTGDKTAVADSTKFSVTTTTGLTAFPTTAKTYTGALVLADKGYATTVYAFVGAAVPETAVNYAVYLGNGEETLDGQMVKFTTGEYKAGTGVAFTDADKGGVYNITVSNGKVTAAEELEGTKVQVGKVSDGYFTNKATGAVVNLAEKVTVLDATDGYKAAEIEADDYVVYFTNKAGAAEFIVIVPAE